MVLHQETPLAELHSELDRYVKPPATLISADRDVVELARKLRVDSAVIPFWEHTKYSEGDTVHRLYTTDYTQYERPVLITDGLRESWDGNYASDTTFGRRVMHNFRRLFNLGAHGILWPDIVPFSMENEGLRYLERELNVFGIPSRELGKDPIHLWVPRPGLVQL